MYDQQPQKPPTNHTDNVDVRTLFQAWYNDGGFWSDFGYDGLSVIFDVPLDTLQSLPDQQKRALMHLLRLLADPSNIVLQEQILALATYAAPQRLDALLNISAELSE
jgi:hypothetical protein